MTVPAFDIHLDAGDVGTALLRQATYWKTRRDDGQLQLVTIDGIGADHQRRLLGWLRRNAEVLHGIEQRALSTQRKTGRLDDQSFAEAMGALERRDPAEWLEDSTLVRRLVQLVPRREPLRGRGLLRIANPRRWWR